MLAPKEFQLSLSAMGVTLHNALLKRLSERAQGRHMYMSVETLLLLLNYIEDDNARESLSKTAKDAKEVFGPEMLAWADVNLPEFSGMSLSWVIKVCDLYI